MTKTDTTVVFTGSDFFTAGFNANSSLAGVYADTIVVDSATQVTATWNKGVPALSSPSKAELFFKTTTADDSLTHYSVMSVDVTKELSIASTSSGLQCSFAGGCLFKVTAPGLSSQMKSNPSKNYISLCGNKCTYSDADSSASEAACKLPSLSTSKSVSTFKIGKSGYLDSKSYFGSSSAENYKKVFDKNNMNYNEDSSASCHVGMQFREGYVGVLSKVRFFLGDNYPMSTYA